MKKILVGLITYVILFNFIFCYHTYAAEKPDSGDSFGEGGAKYLIDEDTAGLAENDISDMLDSGQAGKTSSNQFDILEDKSLLGAAVGLFGFVLSVLPMLAEILLSFLGGFMITSQATNGYFTIEKVVFNQIGLFDANFFNFDPTYVAGDLTVTVPSYIQTAKENIAKFYYVIRYIAIALSLLTLIYVGIRMAIASVAEQQAKYKKMFVGWVESVIILFLIQYIISAMFFLNKVLVDGCWQIYKSLNAAGGINFEENLIISTFSAFQKISGVGVIYLTVSLWVLAFVHVKFFWLYIKRFFMTGFLIVVAPLITVTYPIDKAGDGKAQAFQAWMRELALTCMIQPIHCVIYMVFNETAGEISKVAPVLALILLVLISYAENIVRKIILSKEKSAVVGGMNEVTEGLNKTFGDEGLVGAFMKSRKKE